MQLDSPSNTRQHARGKVPIAAGLPHWARRAVCLSVPACGAGHAVAAARTSERRGPASARATAVAAVPARTIELVPTTTTAAAAAAAFLRGRPGRRLIGEAAAAAAAAAARAAMSLCQ